MFDKNQKSFQEGDFVVYPAHGVGRVEGIEHKTIAGHDLSFYVITFEANRLTLRVPMNKISTSGLRSLSTRKMMDQALLTLKGRARVKRSMWSRRAQEYVAKINSGDPLSIAEVLRDLYRHTSQAEQSFSERQIYETAFDRLVDELAAIEKIDRSDASGKLEDILSRVA